MTGDDVRTAVAAGGSKANDRKETTMIEYEGHAWRIADDRLQCAPLDADTGLLRAGEEWYDYDPRSHEDAGTEDRIRRMIADA